MTTRRITRCRIASPRIQEALTLAVLSDLHNDPFDDVLETLRCADAILFVGDLLDRHHPGLANATAFLQQAPRCAPTFLSLGNHEWKSAEWPIFRPLLLQSDITVLDNAFTAFRGLTLGGLSSAPKEQIQTAWLRDMARQAGFRLLMCHHPEWYEPYVQPFGLDLTVAGHAHGGQVSLFGHGLYAPGQGLFPRLTCGFYDNGHLLVNRGMTNACGLPRFGNPCEMLMLRLENGKETTYAM